MMEQAFVIRPIAVGEVETARRLIYSVARGLFMPEKTLEAAAAHWDARGTLRDLADVRGNYFENGGVFWVMVVDGQMVGTGAFCRYAEGVCELRRLWLLPEFQGRGLGYAMLMALIGRAREMGYGKMCLLTDRYHQPRAVAFYERVGFVEAAREGADAEDLWMEMRI